MLSAPWYLFSDSPLQEQAAAERQLKHQISAALDEGFIVHNPDHPEFRTMTQHNQYGLCNPDNRYFIATISTEGDYVIRGKRGSSASLEIQVDTGNPGYDENLTSPITISQLSEQDLIASKDGSFEIIISDQDPAVANWLDSSGTQDVFIFMRWQGLPKCHEFSEIPTAEMVKVKDLRERLKNEPYFSPEQRAEQLSARKASSLTIPRGF